MTREEIERGFVGAGWEVPGPSRYPVVGNAGDLSIVAHEQYAATDDPAFELVDGRRVVSYWVRVIPTPGRPRCCSRSVVVRPRKNGATRTNAASRTKIFGASYPSCPPIVR